MPDKITARPCLCASGHGCLLDVVPLVPAMEGLISVAEAMLEEAHIEARFCGEREDTVILLAKRDALSELVGRLKHGRRNPQWTRIRPSIQTGL